ncbi:phage tail protein, partial [Streptomyces sp. 12297]
MTRRRLVPGLPTPHPLGPQLPAVYAEDDTAQRITEALDEVLAPVLAVLDSLPAYFDPRLAPEDFGELLAAWVGADGPAAVPGAVRGYAARG